MRNAHWEEEEHFGGPFWLPMGHQLSLELRLSPQLSPIYVKFESYDPFA